MLEMIDKPNYRKYLKGKGYSDKKIREILKEGSYSDEKEYIQDLEEEYLKHEEELNNL